MKIVKLIVFWVSLVTVVHADSVAGHYDFGEEPPVADLGGISGLDTRRFLTDEIAEVLEVGVEASFSKGTIQLVSENTVVAEPSVAGFNRLFASVFGKPEERSNEAFYRGGLSKDEVNSDSVIYKASLRVLAVAAGLSIFARRFF